MHSTHIVWTRGSQAVVLAVHFAKLIITFLSQGQKAKRQLKPTDMDAGGGQAVHRWLCLVRLSMLFNVTAGEDCCFQIASDMQSRRMHRGKLRFQAASMQKAQIRVMEDVRPMRSQVLTA